MLIGSNDCRRERAALLAWARADRLPATVQALSAQNRAQVKLFCDMNPAQHDFVTLQNAASNQLACAPGSQSAKTRRGLAFNERGGPHPHAQSRLAAFFCIRPNSHVYGIARELVARGIGECDKVDRDVPALSAIDPRPWLNRTQFGPALLWVFV